MNLVYHLVADLGVVVLLFFAGLQTRVADILRVGGRAALVAILGVVLPFVLGMVFMGPMLGHPQLEAIFTGAALVATSVGITARVLRDLGVLGSTETRIILGAAVIDDILAMLILAVVAGLASTGSINLRDIVLIVGQAVAFTAFLALLGTGAMRRYGLGLEHLRMEGAPFAVAMALMLGLAAPRMLASVECSIGSWLTITGERSWQGESVLHDRPSLHRATATRRGPEESDRAR